MAETLSEKAESLKVLVEAIARKFDITPHAVTTEDFEVCKTEGKCPWSGISAPFLKD